MPVKDLIYITINILYSNSNSILTLYLSINEIHRCIEENDGNKYLTLVPTGERKNTLKKYDKLWSKIKDLIKSITNNADNCDENI